MFEFTEFKSYGLDKRNAEIKKKSVSDSDATTSSSSFFKIMYTVFIINWLTFVCGDYAMLSLLPLIWESIVIYLIYLQETNYVPITRGSRVVLMINGYVCSYMCLIMLLHGLFLI